MIGSFNAWRLSLSLNCLTNSYLECLVVEVS